MGKIIGTIVIAALFFLLLPVFSGYVAAQEIVNNPLEKARAIADSITAQANGLLAITYIEIPKHRNTAGIYYGVHFNMFITKRTDLFDEADNKRTNELIGELFRLTAQNVFPDDSLISHVGIQVVQPDIWSLGGHQRGYAYVLVATKELLLQLRDSGLPAHEWGSRTRITKQILVPTR